MIDRDTSATDAMAAELRRIIEQAEAAREKLADLEQEARQRTRRAAAATETWVRSNPWAALAIGAGIGLIVGALIMRSVPPAPPDDPEPYV
jgi:ElaB/YqjD/DUF883 family membrane-anchored ribosome-binding protein